MARTKVPTKHELIVDAFKEGYDWLEKAGFNKEQQIALHQFVRRIIMVDDLEKSDYRLIEGDGEREIRGY